MMTQEFLDQEIKGELVSFVLGFINLKFSTILLSAENSLKDVLWAPDPS